MAINSINGLVQSQAQQNIQKTSKTLQAALASLVSGVRVNRASDDVAALSIASKLQAETSALRQVSNNLAQLSSLSQVADGGAEQVQNLLEKLQGLAQQSAAPTTNDQQRAALSQQFKQLAAEINRFAENTTFNNRKLLDGSVSGSRAIALESAFTDNNDGGDTTLSIQSLTTTSLFSGRPVDILSASGAQDALNVIGAALGSVRETRASIGVFQQAADFAAANIDSVFANQQAATSVLLDTDFADAATASSQANIQNNAALALLAQGNRLTPALLKLVS